MRNMEIKKDSFGNTCIFLDGMKRGEIKPDKRIIDMLGQTRGTYIGGNQAKDTFGFLKKITDIIF